MRGFSLEATRPSQADVAALAEIAPAARRSISAPFRRGRRRSRSSRGAAADRRVRAGAASCGAQLRVAARARRLSRAPQRRGRCAQLLVIAGDRDQPAGDFRSALEVIDGGLLRRTASPRSASRAIRTATRASSQQELDRVLAAKLEAAAAIGLDVHIVTQFCLDAERDHRLGQAAARSRHRSSGAHRACRPDQSDDADALCEALRRARLGAGARPQGRAGQAPARHVGAGRLVRALAQARATA